MVFCQELCFTWAMLLSFAGTIERAHQERVVEASVAITAGMLPADVVNILGQPDARYGARSGLAKWMMGPRPKQWMYGTTINLQYIVVPELPFPNPLPLNLRLFEYADEDIVIDWSPGDTVTKIQRPTMEVPPEAEEMLDAVLFVNDLYELARRLQ